MSALHQAVKDNDVDEVKRLLSTVHTSKLDINEEDEQGVTALIEACILGSEELVSLLLDAGEHTACCYFATPMSFIN